MSEHGRVPSAPGSCPDGSNPSVSSLPAGDPSRRTAASVEDTVSKLYAAGWAQAEISEFCSIARSTVQRVLARRGVQPRAPGAQKGERPGTSEKQAALAREWEVSGPAHREFVAVKYGYRDDRSARTIVNRVKRATRPASCGGQSDSAPAQGTAARSAETLGSAEGNGPVTEGHAPSPLPHPPDPDPQNRTWSVSRERIRRPVLA